MIKYWSKILQSNANTLVKETFLMLKSDVDLNRSYNGNNWAYQIKHILDEHGFSYVWDQQFDIVIPFESIRQRLIDTVKQKWYSDINNSSRLDSYSLFKHNCELEKYLQVIHENKYRIALTKFRTSSHSLYIETGRYDNTPRESRLCRFCNMNVIENEYHFLLVCPNYRELRNRYLKPYYCHWPNIYKFESLP